MTVKEFMKEHIGENVHLHWEGFNPRTKCCTMDAYSTNQNLAERHGDLEILEWKNVVEWRFNDDWKRVPVDMLLVIVATDE